MVTSIAGINWYLLENYSNNIWPVFIISYWLTVAEIPVVYRLNGSAGSGGTMVHMMS